MLPEVPPFHLELLSILMLALTLAVAVLPFNISATVGLANRPATWPAEATSNPKNSLSTKSKCSSGIKHRSVESQLHVHECEYNRGEDKQFAV
eukprot:g64180.t1